MSIIKDSRIRRALEWLICRKGGLSSNTMLCIYLELPDQPWFDPPYDSSDFGRCLQLLDEIPEVRTAFPTIAEKVPRFAGILANWDVLTAAYIRGELGLSYRIRALHEERDAKP